MRSHAAPEKLEQRAKPRRRKHSSHPDSGDSPHPSSYSAQSSSLGTTVMHLPYNNNTPTSQSLLAAAAVAATQQRSLIYTPSAALIQPEFLLDSATAMQHHHQQQPQQQHPQQQQPPMPPHPAGGAHQYHRTSSGGGVADQIASAISQSSLAMMGTAAAGAGASAVGDVPARLPRVPIQAGTKVEQLEDDCCAMAAAAAATQPFPAAPTNESAAIAASYKRQVRSGAGVGWVNVHVGFIICELVIAWSTANKPPHPLRANHPNHSDFTTILELLRFIKFVFSMVITYQTPIIPVREWGNHLVIV